MLLHSFFIISILAKANLIDLAGEVGSEVPIICGTHLYNKHLGNRKGIVPGMKKRSGSFD